MPTKYIRKNNQRSKLAIRVIGPSIAYVPLTRGLFALIDAEDADRVEQFYWQARYVKSGRHYAFRKVGRNDAQGMHRFITGVSGALVPDHIENSQTLDNRKSNLRIATYAENNHHQCLQKSNTSGYMGVSWHERKLNLPWQARISIDGRQRHLGYFSTADFAARRYDEEAIKVYGEFAYTNFKYSTGQSNSGFSASLQPEVPSRSLFDGEGCALQLELLPVREEEPLRSYAYPLERLVAAVEPMPRQFHLE